MKFICSLLRLMLLAVVAPLLSQERESYDLEDCVRAAVNNHPDLQVMREDLKSADAGYRVAQSANHPTLGLSIDTKQIDKEALNPEQVPIPGRDTKYGIATGLSSSYSIYEPGRDERINNSRKFVEISRIKQSTEYKRIVYKVREAYYELLMSMKNLQLKEASLDRYTIIYKKMQIYAGAGETGPVELSNWEIVMSNAELDYEMAQQRINDARSRLFLSMGLEDDGSTDFELSPVEDLPEVALSVEELQLLAVNHSPSIMQAQISENMKKAEVDIQKERRHPNLELFGSLGYKNDYVTDEEVPVDERFTQDKWQPSFIVGLRSRMPLYTGGAIPGGIDKAKAEYNKSRFERKDIVLSVKSDVKDMYQTLNFLKKQIEISKRKIITSKTNLRIVERNYESGMSESEDVLDATESLYNAEMSFVSAKVEYKLLVSSLANLIGVEEEYICQK